MSTTKVRVRAGTRMQRVASGGRWFTMPVEATCNVVSERYGIYRIAYRGSVYMIQWDNMGRGFIVYPVASDAGWDTTEDLAKRLAKRSREVLA